MDITFLGHASFKIKGKAAVVITDPYGPDLGLKFPKSEADIVTISHNHYDHNAANLVSENPFIINGPGAYEIKGVKIIGVSSFHDEKGGSLRGKNTIYCLRVDEVNICHLGDLGQTQLTSEQLDSLGQVDVLLIPTGGVYTIDSVAAAKIAASLEPKIIIPMHYADTGIKVQLEPKEKFLKEMGVESVQAEAKLSLSKEKLPPETQVIVLEKKS